MSDCLPLAGVRVLDLSAGAGAAGACVRLLTQLGAAIERLDARRSPGQARALATRADVSVSDLRPAEAHRLGLDAAILGGPGRAVVSVTPFGLDGPDADRPDEAAACAGMDTVVATALAGAHAAAAGLAALRWARHDRRGALAEVATLEVVAACLGDLLPRATCPRRPAGPAGGTPHRGLAVLPCADGYVGVAASTVVDRDLLAGLTGVESVRAPDADPGQALGLWLAARTRDEVFHAAQLWRLPVVPMLAPDEVYADAQCGARGVWAQQDGRMVARSPFRFSKAAPSFGGHGCSTSAEPVCTAPLADVTALDLGMVWAGPYCGRLLAGLGARVVKIEGPARRDGTRPKGGGGCGGAFADLNRGKESLVLDLGSTAGRAAFLRLAARADIVLENFSPRVMPNFGLDYAALARANPRLVMLSLPAFGASGPWADYVAYGSGLELASGLAPVVDGRPAPAPVAYLDYLAGTYGAVGLLAALLARDRTGDGAYLEVAQREVACQVLSDSVRAGRPPRAWSLVPETLRAHPHLAARGLFAAPAADDPCHHYGRLPWRLPGVAPSSERAAPAFGADSRRVLSDLAGMGPAEIEELIAAGVAVAREPDDSMAATGFRCTGAGPDGSLDEGMGLEARRGAG
jgi:crotonobetainyl-CoA:carnitine CoA-transferase CaiB-like acyl-CoA transferase